ncbi:UxaA family hydrolase [Natronospora cellulosivora (SeqCode)]
MPSNILIVNEADNVAVALSSLKAGTEISTKRGKIRVQEEIPRGHKLALEDIKKGEKVIKYAFPIGEAKEDIQVGNWIHSHNLKTALDGKQEYEYNPSPEIKGFTDSKKDKINNSLPTFKGYKREDGQVGIRNEIWLIPTVGCINKPVEKMAMLAEEKFKKEIAAGKIDGVNAFPHPYGCSQLGGDLLNTQKILAGLVNHPNAAAVLVVGLGCENNLIEDFKEIIGEHKQDRVKFMNLQDIGDGIEEGINHLSSLLRYASKFESEDIPVSELKVGLKCGGSDAFSGITANPLLGRISDCLEGYGGTSILTEVPEMFGAETILMNRAANKEIFKDTVRLINNFKDYFMSNNQPVYENPSPGNKEGGITTLEEKSLGCTQKGGTSIVQGVNLYGSQIRGKGLQLLESPGNDLVSTTALTAAGAHLILFTTGRGTPFGAPVPTVKVSTNTPLFEKKSNWMDFNAGSLLEGEKMDELADKFFKYILQLASSEIKTNNEKNDYREIAIFKTGVTL